MGVGWSQYTNSRCYNCGMQGHMQNSCPFPPAGGVAGQGVQGAWGKGKGGFGGGGWGGDTKFQRCQCVLLLLLFKIADPTLQLINLATMLLPCLTETWAEVTHRERLRHHG